MPKKNPMTPARQAKAWKQATDYIAKHPADKAFVLKATEHFFGVDPGKDVDF